MIDLNTTIGQLFEVAKETGADLFFAVRDGSGRPVTAFMCSVEPETAERMERLYKSLEYDGEDAPQDEERTTPTNTQKENND